MRHRSPNRASSLEADPVEHYTRLAEEFGHPRRGHYRARDEGRPVGPGKLLLQPLSLFIIALMALVIVSGVQLWRVGMFDSIFGSKSAVLDNGPKRWMLNGRAARVPDDRTADADEPEAEADEDSEE